MALNNFIGKRKWKAQFEAGRDAMAAGNFQQAEQNLQQALEHAVNISERDSSYGDTALLLGQVYRRTERLSEADDMSKKAFEYYSSVFGPTDPRTIQAHLAIVLSHPEESQQDGDVVKATYELARSQFGDASWQMIRTASLALPGFSSKEREKVLADVQKACQSVLGEERMKLATWPGVAEEFAMALSDQGYRELAAKFMGLQLRMNEERFGAKSQEAALARLNLGELFLQAGMAHKAEVAFSRSIEQLKLKIGPRSPEVQRATVSLARALAQQKKLDKAAPHLTEALSLLSSTQITERLDVLAALLEQKCLAAGTDSERGALWQELESLWERSSDVAMKERIFAGLMAAQNRLQQAWELSSADRFLHAVLARVRQWRGPHHPDVALVMMELCSCAIGLGDNSKAESFLEQSLALDEGVDNVLRAAYHYARLGDSNKASQQANQAKRLLKTYPTGVDQGRRQWRLSLAYLANGDLPQAREFSYLSERQLPESERLNALATLGRIDVLEGKFKHAVERFQSAASHMTDPYDRSVTNLHLAWVLTRIGQFTDAREALKETEVLTSMRPDHPVAYQVLAVSSQIAFYTGGVYEGRELRGKVLNFLRAGRHEQTTRSLDILLLLEPFGPDDGPQELDIGTQILAATEFPEKAMVVFPALDAASVGLRHVTRALNFQDQEELATERLNQYRERFFSFYQPDHPVASVVHLTYAGLTSDEAERLKSLELAVRGLRELSPTHISLFPTLSKLTESYIRAGNLEAARSTCQSALEFRQSPRLVEWSQSLEAGTLPALEGEEPPKPAERPTSVSLEKEEDSAPQESEELPVEPSAAATLSIDPAPVRIHEPEPDLVPEALFTEEEDDEDDDIANRSTADIKVPSAIMEEEPTSPAPTPAPAVAVSGGSGDLAQLKLARFLSERAEAPTPEETQEFLNEVKARFGQEVQPNLEARVLLALLFSDGAPEAAVLWKDALALVPDDAEGILLLENRARDAGSWSLVVQTIKEKLGRENQRYGENAVETLETQMRLAKALEAQGRADDAYRRLTMVAEILRSWFGARSRRLLEPLAELIRVAESLNDVQAAFEHQLERHRLLEAADGDAEELFNSRISLLPIRGRLGQMEELLQEAASCEQELMGFKSHAASEFVRVLLLAANRADGLHWRSDVASVLLETALRVLPENEVSLGCQVRIALAECQFRKDYRSQARRVRDEAIKKAGSLDADARAEMLYLAAESCMRIHDVDQARSLAEKVLEERIAQAGRKDLWAGRALLVMAEADLKTYRLEGTETAIGMSAPSLQGTRYWSDALALKLQALFFLNRFQEADQILDGMSPERALDLRLKLSIWKGDAQEYLRQMMEEPDSLLAQRWTNLESLGLDHAVTILEFLSKTGQVALLTEGYARIADRADSVLQSDLRFARLKIVEARLSFWMSKWEETAFNLQRIIELIPEGAISFPDGLLANAIRIALLTCYLRDGRSSAALMQAQQGASESAELLGEEDLRAVAFRMRLAQCAQALGQLEDALEILDEIMEPIQELLGESHVLLRDVYRTFAQTFLKMGDLESARMSAEEALRINTECRGLSIHLLHDLELCADIEAEEELSEAVNILDTALTYCKEVLPEGHLYIEQLGNKRDTLQTREEEAPVPEQSLVSPEDEDAADAKGGGVEESIDSAEALFTPEAEDLEDEPDQSDQPEVVDSAETLFAPVEEQDELEEDDFDDLELSPEESAELAAAGLLELEESRSGARRGEDESLETPPEEASTGTLEVDNLFDPIPGEAAEGEEVAEPVEEEGDEEAEEVAELEDAEDDDEEAEEVAELVEDEDDEEAEKVAEFEEDEDDDEEAEEVAELVEDEDDDEEAEEVAELVEDEDDDEEAEEVAELVEDEDDEEEAEEVAEFVEDEDDDEEAEEVAELVEDEDDEEAEEVAELVEDEDDDEEAEEVAELEEDEVDEEAEEVAELVEDEVDEGAEEVAELVEDEDDEEADEVAELVEDEDDDEEAEEVAELVEDEDDDEEAEEVAELVEDEDDDEEAEEVAELVEDEDDEEAEKVAELEEDEDDDEEAEEVAELVEDEDDEEAEEVAELVEDEDDDEEAEEVAELEEDEVDEEAEEVAELVEDEDDDEEAEEVAELVEDDDDEEAEEVAELVEDEDDDEEAEEVAELEEDEVDEGAEEVAELVEDEDDEEADEVAELEEDDDDEEAEEVAELVEDEDDEEAEEVAELVEDEDDDEEAEEVAELVEDEDDEEAEEVAELVEDEDDEEAEEVAELVEDEDDEEAEEVAELVEDEDDEEAEEVAELEEGEDEEEEVAEVVEDEDDEEGQEDSGLGWPAAAVEVSEDSGEEESDAPPRPYRVSAQSVPGRFVSTSSSVELQLDFPEVPLRLPHISEDATEAEESIEESVEESQEESQELVSEETFNQEQLFESDEVSVEVSEDEVEPVESSISIERILEISDPESNLLPLAPVFFLPVPWREATEAPFDNEFDGLYQSFQAAFSKGMAWRPVVEEAVSTARLKPSHASGYFLFLLGAQLEKSGHLHTADICLATAIELLDQGSPFGAACHLAGRVAGRRGELSRALEYFERSAELAGEAELAVLKIDAAECHLGMGRPEEALLGFEEVFEYLAENAPKVQALAVQAKMAQIHLLIGDPDTSLALAEQTRKNLSPKNAGTYRVLGRILLSRAFARLGRHELAKELAEKAWEGAEPWSAKRKDGRRIAISNLVDIYCLNGEFEAAQKLLAESGLTGWGLAEAEVLLRAGHVACALGQRDRARTYLHLGKSFMERFQSPALWRSCFLELEAEINLQEGEYLKAQANSKAALTVFEREATGPVDRSRHIVRAAKIMAAQGEFDTAREMLEQAHSLRDLHLGSDHPHTSSVEGLTAVLG